MIQKKSMVTGSNNIEPFINLGNQPNGNIFFYKENINMEKDFTLSMSVCKDSWLVQLDEFPEPEEMYNNHPYISGYSKPIVEHFDWLSRHLIEKYNLAKHSLILDIGANDGTLINSFKEKGMLTLGIDPGSITGKIARENGALVAKAFWKKNTGTALKELNLIPKLITATAVFYHIPNLHEFVDGLDEAMDSESIFICQCVYLKDVIEKLQFDHFYHEHTCIYSVNALKILFEMHNMKLIDVEYSEIHGGSIIAHAVKSTSSLNIKESVSEFINLEKKAGLMNIETYKEFSKKVETNIEKLVSLLKTLKKQGKSVYGIGAPVKGSTLLNYANIDSELISKVVDVNPYKIGKVVPGVHIPIVDEKEITEHPDYYLLLVWNFKDYFLEKYKGFLKSGGKIIIPNPELHIVNE